MLSGGGACVGLDGGSKRTGGRLADGARAKGSRLRELDGMVGTPLGRVEGCTEARPGVGDRSGRRKSGGGGRVDPTLRSTPSSCSMSSGVSTRRPLRWAYSAAVVRSIGRLDVAPRARAGKSTIAEGAGT